MTFWVGYISVKSQETHVKQIHPKVYFGAVEALKEGFFTIIPRNHNKIMDAL